MPKRYKLTLIYTLLILCLTQAVCSAKTPFMEITAETDKTTVTIAEHITLKITATSDADILYELNLPEKQTGVFEVLNKDIEETKETKNKKTETVILTLSTLETGHHAIDLPKIKYFTKSNPKDIKTLEIPAIPIHIKSLIPEGKITDLKKLKDIKDPVLLPTDKKKINKIIIIMLLSLLGLILILWIISFYLRRKNNPTKHIKTPYEIAMEELILLEKEHLIEHQQVKEYYFKLSVIVRKYLEGRFSIDAPTLTTEEFFKVLTGKKILDTKYMHSLNMFLESCDYVKFAKYIPEKEEIKQTFGYARNFVEETKEEEKEEENNHAD